MHNWHIQGRVAIRARGTDSTHGFHKAFFGTDMGTMPKRLDRTTGDWTGLYEGFLWPGTPYGTPRQKEMGDWTGLYEGFLWHGTPVEHHARLQSASTGGAGRDLGHDYMGHWTGLQGRFL